MLNNETRKLILKAYDNKYEVKEIAKYYSVDKSTVYRLIKRRNETGDYRTRVHLRGRKPALSEGQKEEIIDLVKQQPDITLREIIERLQLKVCKETVRRALIDAGYTYKKKSLYAKERRRLRCL